MKERSQRLPNKNLRSLGGRPLFRFIIETLSGLKEVEHTYVYASSPVFSKNLPDGVSWLPRDKALDEDSVSGTELFQSFAKLVNSDYYLLAHATSPFLKRETISKLFRILDDNNYDSAFTGEKMTDYFWLRDKPVNFEANEALPRTQDLPPLIRESSGAYLFSRNLILSEGRRVGLNPLVIEQAEEESIDIDTPFDWKIAECWLQRVDQL